MEIRENPNLYSGESWRAVDKLLDLGMGVLARHFDSVITNDAARPIPPLPFKFPSEIELLEFEGMGRPNPCAIMDLAAELRSEMKAEWSAMNEAKDPDFSRLDDKTFDLIIETAKGVLARFDGVVIVDDDEGMPVAPLPPRESKGS